MASRSVRGADTSVGVGPGLVAIGAEIYDRADRAVGPARLAYVAAMKDQPVMRVLQKLARHDFHQLVFHLADVVARSKAGPVGNAEDVRVYGDRRHPERAVQDHVGCLTPD